VISMNWEKLLGEFADLADDYRQLPHYLAKKYLVAAMREAIKQSKGPQLLRKNTPPLNTRRGRKAKGVKRSTGALRRSVTTKAKWIGRNKDGFAVAGLGYKFGMESRKAIWHEFGTTRMAGRKMMEKTFDEIRGPVASALSRILAQKLENAAAELASKKNPGMSARGRSMGM
jgi:hypothetical protein